MCGSRVMLACALLAGLAAAQTVEQPILATTSVRPLTPGERSVSRA